MGVVCPVLLLPLALANDSQLSKWGCCVNTAAAVKKNKKSILVGIPLSLMGHITLLKMFPPNLIMYLGIVLSGCQGQSLEN